MPEYKVLLSFPQPEKPNSVAVVENGAVGYEITGKLKVGKSFHLLTCFGYQSRGEHGWRSG